MRLSQQRHAQVARVPKKPSAVQMLLLVKAPRAPSSQVLQFSQRLKLVRSYRFSSSSIRPLVLFRAMNILLNEIVIDK